MSTFVFEGENNTILRKPDFLFGDAALDTVSICLLEKGNGFMP